MARVNKTDTIDFGTSGLSVVGIAKTVLKVMESLDTNHPNQYTLAVDPVTNKATITRRYQEEI